MTRRLNLAAMTAAFALTFAVILGGCTWTTTGGGKGGDACLSTSLIRPSPEDAETMSIGLGRQIVAHNRFLEKNCGAKL